MNDQGIAAARAHSRSSGRARQHCPKRRRVLCLSGNDSRCAADERLNLLQYLALRRHDLRHVQLQLASRGLSSLGRTESHVRQSLETVLQVLHALDGKEFDSDFSSTAITAETGESLLAAHTDALLGPSPKERGVRIM